MSLTRYTNIDSLSEKQKNTYGIVLMSISLFTGALIYFHPTGLKVPIFIAITALAIFFISGVAFLLHGKISREKYHHIMQSMILLMSIIPLWIAFDPTEKQCRANFIFFAGELPCRIGFGIGAMIILVIFFLSFSSFRERK